MFKCPGVSIKLTYNFGDYLRLSFTIKRSSHLENISILMANVVLEFNVNLGDSSAKLETLINFKKGPRANLKISKEKIRCKLLKVIFPYKIKTQELSFLVPPLSCVNLNSE